jgi:hypothetical protein
MIYHKEVITITTFLQTMYISLETHANDEMTSAFWVFMLTTFPCENVSGWMTEA